MPVFSNPVISGFHPDPSVCRVGDDYYLAVSSFTFLPGIPIFHSTNLIDWEPIGHVFDRPGVIDLAGLHVSDGLWAPTIRHHAGLFYVVTTITRGRQGATTILATAAEPDGPWSDPVVLEAEGIDPSLFFDDDGRCWFTGCRDAAEPAVTGPGELWMRELDLTTLRLVGPSHILWHGAMRGAWVEAPHLYRRDGAYYLVAAEGGTEGNHAVTVARAETVTGPYLGDPRNPLLTHRHLAPDTPIQNVGHADLVDTADGETWAVLLATRPVSGYHLLGREVFLVRVDWTPRGPVFAPGIGEVRSVDERPRISLAAGPDAAVTAVRSAPSRPGLGWVSLRELPAVADPTGDFTLALRPDTLAGVGRPAFLGRRHAHPEFTSSLVVDFEPTATGEEAGYAIHQGATGYATVTVQRGQDGREIVLTVVAGSVRTECNRVSVPDGAVRIVVGAVGLGYVVEFATVDDLEPRPLGRVDGRHLSTERVGGFVGVVLGPYATSNGQPTIASARFTGFTYAGAC
ncbi:glycoside hydrolase family 43 protein [Cryobacterium zongtaii]|uniref:Glycoside hydrolase family 43 protein n=1 Tax=Cryobacterium zongtaii TaxID=1259217 RepID=A0A2S3ZGW7_9MICO|nr:glycoside hydrolase family 43 protein [Cryobacterium zongtaii]POH66640.1 glycoside hydrolase family 43 protein [Cryobacterium zongtaii]